MTLDEAINHCVKKARDLDRINCKSCAEEHRQLKKWLQALRNVRVIVKDYKDGDLTAEQAMEFIGGFMTDVE